MPRRKLIFLIEISESYNFLGVMQHSTRGQQELDGISEFHHGSYFIDGGKLRPQKIHPDWIKLVQAYPKTMRMCSHDPFLTYCGSCYLGPMRVLRTEEIPRKPRTRDDKRRRKPSQPIPEEAPLLDLMRPKHEN
jgi:hypothetical protein